MSFRKIVLPDSVLTDFFKDKLVLIDNEIDISTRHKKEKPAITTSRPPKEVAMEITAAVKNKPTLQPAILNDSATQDIPVKVAPDKKWFLGDNKKNITIVVNDPAAVYLKDEALEMLSKLLSALKRNLADIAIVNMAHQPVDSRRIKEELGATIVILFGVKVNTIKLPFQIPDYKVQQFNVCSYLQVADFDTMLANTKNAQLEKSKLWVSLKSLLSV